MGKRVLWLFSVILKISTAIVLSCLLVIFIPMVQKMLVEYRFQKEGTDEKRRVLAEIVQPPKKEVKKATIERIRNVGSRMNKAGHGSGAAGMKFSFTPDLSVEGGGGEVVASTKDFTPLILEEGQADEDIIPVFTPMPPYPPMAREQGVEGEVEIVFVVDTDGRIESINIVRAPHSSFIPHVRKTLLTWRFKPAKNQGVPVKLRVRQIIQFKLDE